MVVSSSQVDGGVKGVWLRVRMLKSLVFSLRTTVRGMRDSLREAVQTFSARRQDHGFDLGEGDVAGEGVFGGDGLGWSVGDDGAVVDAAG